VRGLEFHVSGLGFRVLGASLPPFLLSLQPSEVWRSLGLEFGVRGLRCKV
jgi:hypothetical protein